jgi:hypothetical protein
MKLEDGETTADAEVAKDVKSKDSIKEGTTGTSTANQIDRNPSNLPQSGWSRRDGNQRAEKTVTFIFSCICEKCWFGALSLNFFFFFFF